MTDESFGDRIDRERAENIARYRELYQGVAKYLDGWTVVEKPDEYAGYRFHLASSEVGQKITLDINKDKVHVSGYWPQRSNNGPYTAPSDVREESPSINCSLARGHELIARDVSRRFIPEYLRIWAKIKAKMAEDDAYSDRKTRNWQRLVTPGGVLNPRQSQGNYEDSRGDIRMPGGYDRGYGDVRMTGEDSVTIELRSLPVDVAIKVLKALSGGDK